MEDLQKQKDFLLTFTERQNLEFFEGLRSLLQGIYRWDFTEVAEIIAEFRHDILQNGVFYIDPINENLAFLLKQTRVLSSLQIHLFLGIIENLLPICNRRSLEFLKIFSKKIGSKNFEILGQIQKYVQKIQMHMHRIEQDMDHLVLHPYKDILDNYLL